MDALVANIIAVAALLWGIGESIVRWVANRRNRASIQDAEVRAKEAHGFASNADQRAASAEARAEQSLELQKRLTEAAESMNSQFDKPHAMKEAVESNRWAVRFLGRNDDRIVYEIRNLLETSVKQVTVAATAQKDDHRIIHRLPKNRDFGPDESVRFFEEADSGRPPLRRLRFAWPGHETVVEVSKSGI